MRLRHSATPLPRDWSSVPDVRGLLLDHDLRIDSGRLRAKLLVFDSLKNLRSFWKDVLGKGDLGKDCRGAVNGLIQEIHYFPGKKDTRKESLYLEADSRYYCVIGLVRDWLTMEVICHEAVHAAFSYTKRVRRNPWSEQIEHFHEEELCYPAGKIATTILNSCRKAGLLD